MPKTKATSPHRVGVVQHPPVLLHRDKTVKRGVELMEKAAAGGARLVSFPETWLPGYPEWVWRLRPGDDYELTTEIPATGGFQHPGLGPRAIPHVWA
jgi:nitrilase